MLCCKERRMAMCIPTAPWLTVYQPRMVDTPCGQLPTFCTRGGVTKMTESRSAGELGKQRQRLYTNVPTTVLCDVSGDHPYFRLNMDTWYFSEWADPNHWAILGTAAVGDGPLTPAQG